jgi:hypothetical protein
MHDLALPRANYAPERSSNPGMSLFAFGVWIRLGFVGVSAVIAALVCLADPQTPVAPAVAAALAGAALAAFSWRRVKRALDEDDTEAHLALHAPSPR